MHKIIVEGIKLYGYHGCLEEEGKVGGNYEVDVVMEADFSKAADNDDLKETIDYVLVFEVAKKEMAIRSKLIESVAKRIAVSLHSVFPALVYSEVKLTKIKPPIHGDVRSTSVIYITDKRS
jgi:dihydroneopterin aldolase